MQVMIFFIGFLFSSFSLFSSGPGYLDPSFNSSGIVTTSFGGVDTAYASAVQPDGKILVVGSAGSDIGIVRYTIEGALDTAQFGNPHGYVTQAIGTTAVAYGIAVQNNGKIVVAGSTTTTGTTQFFVAQFLSSGALDTAGFGFGTGYVIQSQIHSASSDVANAVVLDGMGNIYVIGTSTQSSAGNIFVAQYNSSGSLNTSTYNSGAGHGGNGTGKTVAGIALLTLAVSGVQTSLAGYAGGLNSTGKMVVAGSAGSKSIIVQFTTTGVLDTGSFNVSSTPGYNDATSFGGTDVAYALGFQTIAPDAGKIIIAGGTGTYAFVARYTVGGVLDTTFNSTGYNATNSFGGSVATAYGLIIQYDDSLIIGGTVTNISTLTDFVIANYLDDGSALNTTDFGIISGSSTLGYMTTDISGSGSADTGRSVAVQSNGRFVVAGTTGTGTTHFAVTRYLGQPGVQGCMDVTYNSSSTPGFITDPTDTTASDLPQVVSVQCLNDSDSVFVLTINPGAGSPSTQLVELNSNGTLATSSHTISQAGGANVVEDSHSRALVVGGNGTNGWMARYVVEGSSFVIDGSFNGGSILVQSSSPTTASYLRVCEQATGTVVAMGQDNSGNGILVGYNQNGSINTGFGTSGFYTLSNVTLTDMVVDIYDYIYLIGSVPSGDIQLYRLYPNASGFDPYFNGGSPVDTGLQTSNYQGGLLGGISDSTNLTALVSINTASAAIEFQSYDNLGNDDLVNTIEQTTSLLTNPVITALQIDSYNNLIYSGYDQNFFIAGRLLENFTLDTTFAPYSTTPSILKTKYDDYDPTGSTTPQRQANSIGISPDGVIIFGGFENINSSSTIATIGNIVGIEGGSPAYEIVRYPGAQIGNVNPGFGGGGAGNPSPTPSLLDFVGDVGYSSAFYLYVLANGNIVIASTNGSDTTLALVNSSFSQIGSFGEPNISNLANIKNMTVDLAGNIYIVGDDAGNNIFSSPQMVLSKISSSGSIQWTTTSNINYYENDYLTTGNVVLQETSGAMIVAGYGYDFDADNYYAAIAAYSPIDGTIDVDFSGEGYYFLDVNAPIMGAAITSTNEIVFTYQNESGYAAIQKILEDGSGLDPNFGTGTQTLMATYNNTDIRLQQDVNGKIVVVVIDSSGDYYNASRYTSSGNNDVVDVHISPNNIYSVPQMQQMLALSDGSILVMGTDDSGAVLEMFKLISSFALDTNFSYSTGFLETGVSGGDLSMTNLTAFDVTSSQNILVAGAAYNSGTGNYDPCMTEVYNDSLVTKVNQSTAALGNPGIVDVTYNELGDNPGYLNMHLELTTDFVSGTSAKSILQINNNQSLEDNYYYVAGDNGTNSYITYFSSDDIQQTDFGSSGVVEISGKADVAAMIIDQEGYFIVVGGSGSSGSDAGWIVQLNASTGVATSFNGSNYLDACYAVCQQSDGRILVAGQQDGYATIVAYNSVTGALDTTFGNNGFYTPGVASTQFNSILVDSTDHIYVMANNGSGNAVTYKLVQSGASVLASSNTLIDNATIDCNYIAFDQNNNNIIAATINTSNSIAVARYTSSNMHLSGSILTITTATTNFANPAAITGLLVDTNGKIILTGYTDVSRSLGIVPFVIRILENLTGLDTSFNSSDSVPGIQTAAVPTASGSAWFGGIINQEGKILVAGYGILSSTNTPYLMQVYGDDFIGQYLPGIVAAGAAGTIDTNFGSSGVVQIASLSGASALSGKTPEVVIPLSDGYYYIAFSDGHLIRLTNQASLDTTLAPADTGFLSVTPAGVYSLLLDGGNLLVAAGTASGAGWVKRYLSNSSSLDTTFNSNVTSALSTLHATVATTIVQQTLGRYVIAGQLSNGDGALFALNNVGQADVTFNSNGSNSSGGGGTTPGAFDTGVSSPIYSFVTDVYDRIIFALFNSSTNAVDLYRLTSAGQIDATFGSGGVLSGAISNVDIATQVHVALDVEGNIVIATLANNGSNYVAVAAYVNGAGTVVAKNEYDLIELTGATFSTLVATADGSILLAGYESGSNDMWVARVIDNGSGTYELDPSFADGSGILFFQFNGSATVRLLNEIAIYGDGQITMIGAETVSSVVTPFLSMAYNNPYTSQEPLCQNAKPDGTNDITWGASSLTTDQLGVTFFASPGADATSGQVARAIGLQNDIDILVAVDGAANSGGGSADIFFQMFNIDGVANTAFGTNGQQTVLNYYNNQYVRDMVIFTTVAGVQKAIVAGYAYDATLNLYGSLVLQYNLVNQDIDTTFGGFDGNPQGIAFGDGQSLFAVGQQSTGRIIAGGLSQNNLGLLLGYTAEGKLDASFGNSGYQSVSTGATGIYTHAIDTQNRILIAYNNGSGSVAVSRFLPDGSGLDGSFGTSGSVATNISGLQTGINNNFKLSFDESGNIIVAAVTGNGSTSHILTVYSYTSNGTSTNYTTTLTAGSSFAGTSSSTFMMSRLFVDSQNNAIIVIYDSYPTPNKIIVTRLTSAGSLDNTFNTVGYISYQVASGNTQIATYGLIHPDGRIFIAGSED